jgi:GNAT superfamily N-acetyltransferase
MAIDIVLADEARFDDLTTILGPKRLDVPACWCLYYRVTSAEYGTLRGAERPAKLRSFCQREPVPGVLAYVDGVPAGWCAFGPRTEMGRLVRSRTIPKIDELPVWSIVCFVVKAPYRRQGLAGQMLATTVEYAMSQDVPMLEGYPIENRGQRVNSAAAFAGTTSLFVSQGFEKIVQTSARSGGLPRWVMRRDLRTSA